VGGLKRLIKRVLGYMQEYRSEEDQSCVGKKQDFEINLKFNRKPMQMVKNVQWMEQCALIKRF